MKRLVLVVLAAALACSCDQKKKQADPAPEPAQQTEAGGREDASIDMPELAPDVPETEAPMLATPTDFELEASNEIALENLEAELDRLDAEIQSVNN